MTATGDGTCVGSGSWIFKSSILTTWSANSMNSIFVRESLPSGELSLKSWIIRILLFSEIK